MSIIDRVEVPIMMGVDSVRAILEDRKTETRRVVYPQPKRDATLVDSWIWRGGRRLVEVGYGAEYIHTSRASMEKAMRATSPYGRPGTRLWVREPWARVYDAGDGAVTVLPPTGEATRKALERILHKATAKVPENAAINWRPAIHLRRADARILLEVVDVGVQRLEDISEASAVAEGVANVAAYRDLWDRINTKRGYGWTTNPFVWVIEFRRVVRATDGHSYVVLEIEKRAPIARYKVRREDGSTIENFPGYLFEKESRI